MHATKQTFQIEKISIRKLSVLIDRLSAIKHEILRTTYVNDLLRP